MACAVSKNCSHGWESETMHTIRGTEIHSWPGVGHRLQGADDAWAPAAVCLSPAGPMGEHPI